VTVLVVVLVEFRRPSSARTELLAVADLVGLFRDCAADTASAQVGAVGSGAIRLVRSDLVGFGARPTSAEPRYPYRLQDRLELRTVVPVASSDDECERLLLLLDRQVQLGGQPAT
jgi:hypothetical protein